MSTNTPNYGLKKPAQSDDYNIQDANDNMDIIDTKLKQLTDDNSTHVTDEGKYREYLCYMDIRDTRRLI
jgi:hypothetical protein